MNLDVKEELYLRKMLGSYIQWWSTHIARSDIGSKTPRYKESLDIDNLVHLNNDDYYDILKDQLSPSK